MTQQIAETAYHKVQAPIPKSMYVGYAEYQKPAIQIPDGAELLELDTGRKYTWADGRWNQVQDTVETTLREIKGVLDSLLAAQLVSNQHTALMTEE